MAKSDKLEEKDVSIWSVQRRIKLTRQIAYLGIAVCLLYVVFDAVNEAYFYIPYYFILIAGASICLLLLKFGYVTPAKIILLLSGVLLLGVLASLETKETGLFMFFLVAAVASFTIFGTEEIYSAVTIGLFSLAVFYVVYFTNIFSFEKTVLTEEYIANSFLINFCICLVALMTIVYHIMALSVKYQESVQSSQHEMKQLSTDLRDSKNRFELAIKGSSVGIWDWDIVKDELFMSHQLTSMLGYPPSKYEHVTSERIDKVVHPDDVQNFRELLRSHLEQREPFRVECRLKRFDGSYVWVLDTGQAQWDENGTPQRMLGTIVNINELKRAFSQLEEQNELLEKTNEELDRFVYSTSHDLRAPLSSILGLVNVARSSQQFEEVNVCLEMIEGRVNTLNAFIAEIIDYSRNTRLEVSKEEINLYDLISEVISGLQFFEKSEQIHFDINVPTELLIQSDRGRLRIILNNLIANAIKYHTLDKNPKVTITTKMKSDSLFIDVEDNGPGIDQELLDKVFDMFYRASEKSEGSGLGLYIAKEMTAKLNGNLSVESQLNQGSCFRLALPISEVMQQAANA